MASVRVLENVQGKINVPSIEATTHPLSISFDFPILIFPFLFEFMTTLKKEAGAVSARIQLSAVMPALLIAVFR